MGESSRKIRILPGWATQFGGWDGDTLVVKSAGYNDRTWLDAGGHPHTESLQITERFHRGDLGHLTVDVAYSDPGAYEKPWTAKMEMQYTADTDLLEYVCAENEKDGIHLVGRKSDLTKNAVKLAPEVLSKYVGTYEREALRGVPPVEYRIELDDDGLTLNTPGSPKTPLTALSETIFITSFGLRFEFDNGDKGNATYFIIIAAQGDLRADRKK